MGQEDIVEEGVEVEDFPKVPAETVGGSQSDDNCGYNEKDGQVPLGQLIVRENQEDVLKRNDKGKDKVQQIHEDVLVLSGTGVIILVAFIFRTHIFASIFEQLGDTVISRVRSGGLFDEDGRALELVADFVGVVGDVEEVHHFEILLIAIELL